MAPSDARRGSFRVPPRWAAALALGVLLPGCGSGGVGSVELDAPPDVKAIGAAPRPKPGEKPGRRPARPPGKTPREFTPG